MTVNVSGRAKSPNIDTAYEGIGDEETIDTADSQIVSATAPLESMPAEPLRSGTPTITPTSGLNAMAPQPRTSPRPPLDTIASAAPQSPPVEPGLVQIFKDLICQCFRICRGGAKRTD